MEGESRYDVAKKISSAPASDVSAANQNNNIPIAESNEIHTSNMVNRNDNVSVAIQPVQTEQSLPRVDASRMNLKSPDFDMELWANSLVGRWWEIFWEPTEDEEDDDAPKATENNTNNLIDLTGSTQTITNTTATEDVVMSIRGGGIEGDGDNKNNNTLVKKEQSSNNPNTTHSATAVGQQQRRQSSTMPQSYRRSSSSSSHQHKKSSKQLSRKPSQPYQHRPRFLDYDPTKREATQTQQPPVTQQRPVTQPIARPQPPPINHPATITSATLFNVVYNEPRLGLSLGHQQHGGIPRFIINEVSPSAPNANLLRVGDCIIGINGKRFANMGIPLGVDSEGKTYFSRIIAILKDTPRPMTVNFERRLQSANSAIPNNSVPAARQSSNHQATRPPQQLGVQTSTQITAPLVPNPLVGQSQSAIATHVNGAMSDSKAKATERELQYPLEPAVGFPQGWKKRVVPRINTAEGKKSADTFYYSPIKGYKFRSRPEVQLFLGLLGKAMGDENVAIEAFRREKSRKRGNRSDSALSGMMVLDQSESDATSTTDEEEEDTGEDAIDWYDGKILSYADGNFVVYFLGDTEDVTYTMPLTPKIVRPSVRAWTKRTLAILSCDVDLTIEDSIPDDLVDSLPPTTAIPQDQKRIEYTANDGEEGNNYRRLKEYSTLLGEQIQHAKQLSPHADDDQSGGTVDGKDEGPGPFANKSYVKHLRNCLEQSKIVCDWLSKQADALNTFKRVRGQSQCNSQDTCAATHVARDSIQSFLVNGATFLQSILLLLPNNIEAASNGQSSRSSKRRKLSNTNESSGQQNLVVSTDSLDIALKNILNRSDKDDQDMLMTSTLNEIVSVLYLDLWQPHQDWINEAQDMIYGKSTTFYSFEGIESHIRAAQKLTLFDISIWKIDLEAKLNRARFFEMEAWSAIKACTVLNESGDTTASSDSCLLSLNRLQNELSPSTINAGGQCIMRNMNPLGKQSVSADGTHSLTRDDVENAVKTRQWVLDLQKAKTSRERASFVQSVIERYVTLPQLPSPPFSGFGENDSDATTSLKENTKGSISLLSGNCYSHTHIIGNMAAKLSSSMLSNPQDTELRSKEGVVAALNELRQLPILSIVEEKLQSREKLIEWNLKALQIKESTTVEKVQFQVLEKMYDDLSNILSLTSDQKVTTNEYVEREIKAFVSEDVKLICPESGNWVQRQYKKGCDWRQNYLSIKSALQPHGYNFGVTPQSPPADNKSAVDVSRIRNLLIEHDSLDSCFIEECEYLRSIEKAVNDWSEALDQVLVSDTYELTKRHDELVKIEASRPKCIIAKPPQHIVDLWVRVLKWGITLRNRVNLVKEKLVEWKTSQFSAVLSQDAEFQQSVRLVKQFLSSVIIEGQDFMLSKVLTLSPLLSQLRSITMSTFSDVNCSNLISRRQIIESSAHGEVLLGHVIGLEADTRSGFSLLFVRDIFWKLMSSSLMHTIKNGGRVDLHDVKTFSTLCVCDSEMSVSLNELIVDAEKLQRSAVINIDACSKLLQMNCFQHQDELRKCLENLQSIQTSFKSEHFKSAAGLLRSSGVEAVLGAKLSNIAWLVETFLHSHIFDSANVLASSNSTNPISMDELRMLYERNPLKLANQVGVDVEVRRVQDVVKEIYLRAQEWQKSVRVLLNFDACSVPTDVIKIETIEVLCRSDILQSVTFSELNALQKAASVALELRDGLVNELFCDEYLGIDVNKGRLPMKSSLIASSGEFLLYRFTGGEMYSAIERAVKKLRELSSQLLVVTEDKATVDWILKVFDWVTLLKDAFTDHTAVGGPTNKRLVLKIEHALLILEKGHEVFYSISDEVKGQLSFHKIATKILPSRLSFDMMKQSSSTLGLSLLRWAAFLFQCLKVDLDNQDNWKESVLDVTETYQMFEANGLVSTLGVVTAFYEKVRDLVATAANLVIQDDHLIRTLFHLSHSINHSAVVKKQLEIESVAFEERLFALEKNKFEAPSNIVNARYSHLESLLGRLSTASDDVTSFPEDDDSLFVANDSNARDKSRLFLEKSLFKGMETLGMELNELTRDFVSNLAWELELAIFIKYCSNETLTSDYREKVRSLRFNLQDPKNPMLCTRVVSGQLEISDLIVMSTDALASKQLKQIRQQVAQDSIKNVVISPGTNQSESSTTGITSELAKRIRIDSVKKTTTAKENIGSPSLPSTATSGNSSQVSASNPLTHSESSIPNTFNNSTVSELLAAIPPPPMVGKGKDRPVQLKPPTMDSGSPPSMMQPPPIQNSSFESTSHSHGHHISSQVGSEEFSFTISRLKLSFTSKIFVDQGCEYQLDGFLPQSLVEKGRLPVDEFNKFVNEKSRSNKWKLVIMKLSSMSGGENTSSYKRFYKEYESLRRICMFQVSDATKVFMVTPKFLRICKCVNSVKNLSRTSTYIVVITKEPLSYSQNN